MRYCLLPALSIIAATAACSSDIYLHEGVTDGDTFYLAEQALSDADPALQSWVTYSLARSACQLQIGGDNPARESSFDCELTARRLLLDTWSEQKAAETGVRNDYLDDLSAVRSAGYLDEYVARYFKKRHWELPQNLNSSAFRKWQRANLPRHKPQMRIIGSWNYAKNVSSW